MSFEKLKRLIISGGADEADYERIKVDLYASNRNNVRIFSVIASVTFLMLLILSMVFPGLSVYRLTYLVGFLGTAVIGLIAQFPGKKHPGVLLADVYLFAMILLTVGTVIGTKSSPTEIAAAYIALLLVVPQFFTDRPYRMYFLIAASVCIFIAAVLKFKNPQTHTSDITNVALFGGISMILTTYSTFNRVSRYGLQEQIRMMAENDQLTGLKNRNSYEMMLQKASLRGTSSVYCVYVDVNGLHELNNTEGHKAGDRMLQFIATSMQNIYGEKDTYRTGGDEFTVLGTDQSHEQLLLKLAELKKTVEAAGYHIAAGISYRVQQGISVDEIIREAEMKMYDDKQKYYSENNINHHRKYWPEFPVK